MAADIVIHIGLPKTGTTTLQTALFPSHSQIHYMGKLDRRRRFRSGGSFREKKISEMMKELMGPAKKAIDLQHYRLHFREYLRTLDPKSIKVFSVEGISSGGRENRRIRAERFYNVFGDCKILITLRHPLDFVRTMYLQKLKETQIGPRSIYGKPGQFFDFETWLEANWNQKPVRALYNLDYAHTIDIYSDIFGKDAVKILLFEEFRSNPVRFITQICELIQVDTKEGIRAAHGQSHNPQLTQNQYEWIRSLSQSRFCSRLFRLLPQVLRRWRLERARLSTDSNLRLEIPDQWRQRIEDYTGEGNRRIAEEWRVPLRKYQYPIVLTGNF